MTAASAYSVQPMSDIETAYRERFPDVEFAVGPPKPFFILREKRYVYEVVTSGGAHLDDPPLVRAENVEAAWTAYWAHLTKYLADRKAAFVFWRREPYLDTDGERFWIRSRLVVVD